MEPGQKLGAGAWVGVAAWRHFLGRTDPGQRLAWGCVRRQISGVCERLQPVHERDFAGEDNDRQRNNEDERIAETGQHGALY